MSFLKDFKDLKKDISVAVNEKETKTEIPAQNKSSEKKETITGNIISRTEEKGMSDMTNTAGQADTDITVIAAGTVINGSIESKGSVAVYGEVKGDIECKKKFIASGQVTGDIDAGEIFINKASIDGRVNSAGNLKIGSGSVIQGDVYGQTAVIAGAVKGEIDIKGPVIIDNTAVIKGNIKSRSVQINNGAIIDGYCSQCYNDVDVKEIFKDTFHETEIKQAPELKTEQAPTEEQAESAAVAYIEGLVQAREAEALAAQTQEPQVEAGTNQQEGV